jgi:hypothetical protein
MFYLVEHIITLAVYTNFNKIRLEPIKTWLVFFFQYNDFIHNINVSVVTE